MLEVYTQISKWWSPTPGHNKVRHQVHLKRLHFPFWPVLCLTRETPRKLREWPRTCPAGGQEMLHRHSPEKGASLFVLTSFPEILNQILLQKLPENAFDFIVVFNFNGRNFYSGDFVVLTAQFFPPFCFHHFVLSLCSSPPSCSWLSASDNCFVYGEPLLSAIP